MNIKDLAIFQAARGDDNYPGATISVAYNSDGTLIAGGSNEGAIRLWEIASGRQIISFRCKDETVNSIAFSPDGKTLVSGSSGRLGAYTGNIKMWEVATGRELYRFTDEGIQISQVAYSPAGTTLAYASNDLYINLLDVTNGQVLANLKANPELAYRVVFCFSADGKTLASAGGKSIMVWDLASGQEIMNLHSPSEVTGFICFGSDGNLLAGGNDDGAVRFWNIAEQKEVKALSLDEKFTGFAAFDSNWSLLASSGYDQRIRIWDVQGGREIGNFVEDSRPVAGYYKRAANALAFSPDDRILAAGIANESIRLWQIEA